MKRSSIPEFTEQTGGMVFSQYFHGLPVAAQERYLEKISLCDGMDPYSLQDSEVSDAVELWPGVQFADIVNYLVLTVNAVSPQQMKAYRSLESYHYFSSGWVQEITAKCCKHERVLLMARVTHPHRASCTPRSPWIVSKADGEILTAHCNCMEGDYKALLQVSLEKGISRILEKASDPLQAVNVTTVGESCSHIGAVLFSVQEGTRMRDSTSCTEQVPYLQVKEINFTPARSKKQRLEQSDDVLLASHAGQKPKKLDAQQPSIKPSPEEIRDFYRSISLCRTKPVILSLIPEYAERYVPRQMRAALPSPLTNLFEEKNLQLNLDQLREISKTTVLPPVTPKVVKCVQEETVQQADSKLWFRLRAGRVTASRLHAICHTNPLSPSRDLVLAVCYPEANEIQTPEIRWGIQNEKTATCLYREILKKSHQGVCLMDTGLHLNPKWPFLGATPDGMVTCSCCGTGIYEIKYPYTVRDQCLEDAVKTEFCLVTGEKGGFFLSKTHQYYYQVQAQLHVTGLDYCDFVVWTTKGIHVERIEPDSDFWNSALCKAEQFFRNAVLPELLGKAFSRSPVERRPCDHPGMSNSLEKICVCKTEKRTKTVTCSRQACGKQFHIKCLGMHRVPGGDWLCPDCRFEDQENDCSDEAAVHS